MTKRRSITPEEIALRAIGLDCIENPSEKLWIIRYYDHCFENTQQFRINGLKTDNKLTADIEIATQRKVLAGLISDVIKDCLNTINSVQLEEQLEGARSEIIKALRERFILT